MRVLILADDCNPDWPSLPVVGFKLGRSLGDHADVVIATHVRNRPNIERVGMGRCEVVYLDNEYIAAPMFRLSKILRGGNSVAWTTNIAMNYLPYLAFEREVWRKFRGDLKSGHFDLVHRITPMSPTLPSPMAKWSPQPFVVGPLNGGLKWPSGFTAELVREREYLTYIRAAYRLLPYRQAMQRRAAAILAAFDHTIDDLKLTDTSRVFNVPEVGFDPELFSSPPQRQRSGRITFLFVGRLVPYKCADVAVAAFAAEPKLRQHQLRVVGDGPERPRLAQMISENHHESCVELVGQVKQSEVGEEMRRADVFVFPSIRELGAGVVVEAMASAMACIVANYGAPGALIGNDRGIRIPLGSKEEMIRNFGQALAKTAESRTIITELGQSAHQYAMTHLTWDAKAREILEIYKWVLGQRSDRPALLL
jgi:glycosyltransferase involved in cell wall biosynthesis